MLAKFWGNTVGDAAFGDAVGTKNMWHRVALHQFFSVKASCFDCETGRAIQCRDRRGAAMLSFPI